MSADYERVKTWCNDPRKMPCAPYNSICRVFEDYDRLRARLATAEEKLRGYEDAPVVGKAVYPARGGNAGLSWYIDQSGVMPKSGDVLIIKPRGGKGE